MKSFEVVSEDDNEKREFINGSRQKDTQRIS